MGERVVRLCWTAVSAAGAAFAVANWRDAAVDLRVVRRLPGFRSDGPRAIAGRANVRREQLRAVTQVCCLAVGVATLVADGTLSPRARRWTVAGLLAAQVASVVNDLFDRNDRRKAIAAPWVAERRETPP